MNCCTFQCTACSENELKQEDNKKNCSYDVTNEPINTERSVTPRNNSVTPRNSRTPKPE